MFPELIAALVTHISNNIPKDSLRLDTIRAGYSNAEFEAAYAAALATVQPNIPPRLASTPVVGYGTTPRVVEPVPTVPIAVAEPSQLTPAPQPSLEPASAPIASPLLSESPASTTVPLVPVSTQNLRPTYTPPSSTSVSMTSKPSIASLSPTYTPSPLTSQSEMSSTRSRSWTRIIGFVLSGATALLLFGVVGAAAAGLIPVPTFVQNLFGGAPYSETTPLQEIALGASKISSANFTLSLQANAAPLDGDVYLMPEALKKEVGDPAPLLAFLPKDFTLKGAVSGQFDTAATLPDSSIKIAGSYETPDLSVFADVEAILSQEHGAYVRVNRLPSFFMFDLSAIRENWVHIIEEPLKDVAKDYVSKDTTEKEERIAELKLFLEYADKYHIFTVVGKPESDKVGKTAAYKYTFILNGDTLKMFFMETIAAFDTKFGKDKHMLSKINSDQIDLMSSTAFVQFANTHTKYHIWAGSDGIPLQLEVETRTAIDDDVKATLFGSTFKPDDTKRSALSFVKYATSSYQLTTHSKSYKGFCAYETKRFSYNKDWQVSCADAPTAFALAIKLDVGSYCTDATGYTGYGSLTTASSTTCTKEAEPVIPPPPEAKPERQVHSSLMLTLTDINKPVQITIPEGAMSRDEAIKKVPALEFVKELTKARGSGADASLKAMLVSAKADAEIYYTTKSNSYAGYCASTTAPHENGATCRDSAKEWLAFAVLSTGDKFCVDSTGYSGVRDSITITASSTKLSCLDN